MSLRLPFRLQTTPASDILTVANFTYAGCFAMQASGFGVDLEFSRGAMTGRDMAGVPHLILSGNQSSLYPIGEIIPPASYQPTVALAVAQGPSGRATGYAAWGTHPYGSSPSDTWRDISGVDMDTQNDLLFKDGFLFYNMQASYNVSSDNDRCIGMASLDDPITGACTAYGPWRAGNGPKVVGGYFIDFPSDIASTYFSGRGIGLGSGAISGTSSAPFGLGVLTLETPSTSLPASAYNNESDVAFTATTGARFDISTRQNIAALGLSRKICAWQDPGNYSTLTSTIHAGDTSAAVADTTLYLQPGSFDNASGKYLGYFSTSDTPNAIQSFLYTGRSTTSGAGTLTGIPASGDGSIGSTIVSSTHVLLGKYDDGRGPVLSDINPTWGPSTVANPGDVAVFFDYGGAMTYVRTSGGKQGLLFWAIHPDIVPGYNPYNPDGTCHVWYGAGSTCVHGQVNELNKTITGPQTTSTVPWCYVYDVAAIAAVQDGAPLSDLAWNNAFRFDALTDQIPTPSAGNGPSSGYFHEPTGQLFVCVSQQDIYTVNPSTPLPMVHVFQVS